MCVRVLDSLIMYSYNNVSECVWLLISNNVGFVRTVSQWTQLCKYRAVASGAGGARALYRPQNYTK